MNRLTLTVALTLCAGMPHLLWAQGPERALEEILVTAQKRSQSVQDVPISIAVVSADDIARNSIFDFAVQFDGRFDRGLSVKFRRVRDLEQNIFHHVGPEWSSQSNLFPFKQNVLISPDWGGHRGGVSHFAGHRDQRQSDGSAGRVTRGPTLP